MIIGLSSADNSGRTPKFWLFPDIGNGQFQLKQRVYSLTYFALDLFRNNVSCHFTIEVIDDLPPVIENCFNQTVVLDAMCADDSNKNTQRCAIDYDKPTNYDNSDKHTTDITTPLSRIKNSSIYQSKYTATDLSGNFNTCIVNITVQYEKCTFLLPPKNGKITCKSKSTKSVCNVSCHTGFAILNNGVIEHNLKLQCEHKHGKWPYAEVPDCAMEMNKNLQKDKYDIGLNPSIMDCNAFQSVSTHCNV